MWYVRVHSSLSYKARPVQKKGPVKNNRDVDLSRDSVSRIHSPRRIWREPFVKSILLSVVCPTE